MRYAIPVAPYIFLLSYRSLKFGCDVPHVFVLLALRSLRAQPADSASAEVKYYKANRTAPGAPALHRKARKKKGGIDEI